MSTAATVPAKMTNCVTREAETNRILLCISSGYTMIVREEKVVGGELSR